MTTKRYLGRVMFTALALASAPHISQADVTVTAEIQKKGVSSLAPNDPNARIFYKAIASHSLLFAIADGQSVSLKICVQGKREWMETLNTAYIWDRVHGDQILLNTEMCSYRRKPMDRNPESNPWLTAKIVDMHQWKRIAGRHAYHFLLRDTTASDTQADVWIVPGLEAPAVLLPDLVSSESPGLEAGIARLHGLCVQFDLKSSREAMGEHLIYRVKSISRQRISSTIFTPPKGYSNVADNTLPTAIDSHVPLAVSATPSPESPSMTTDLTSAASCGQIDLTDALLKMDQDINERDRMGNTPLLAAMSPKPMLGQSPADVHEPVAMVKFLIDHHADVNLPNSEDGATPLIDAAVGGYPKVITMLLAHGADPHTKDKTGKTALDWALLLRRTDAAAILNTYPKN